MQQQRHHCRPALVRGVAVMAVLLLTLGGGPTEPVARRAYLSYVVVAERSDAMGAAAASHAVRAAGGHLGPVHRQIGVAVAYADDPGFVHRVRRAPGVQTAGATRTVGTALPAGAGPTEPQPSAGDAPSSGERPEARAGTPPLVPDPAERLTWNLSMINAAGPEAPPAPSSAALRRTVVAVLDSGVDDTHPDLREAVDPRLSASCANGAPDTRSGAWRPLPYLPDHGHGTHIGGIIAASRDGRGVSGVAAGTRIAAVRLLGPAGQYYAENIICGFLWAADRGARVINNSYFADPWKYNCPDDPDQGAVLTAVTRAVRYAQSRGALVVASAGNDGQDLGASRVDSRSPNDRRPGTTAEPRRLGADCIRLPGQVRGVLAVTAVDRSGTPTAYSNYGKGRTWLAAPGGDPSEGPAGQIVSTWPGGRYAALSGTSMAAAHVSAAAAVEAARDPWAGPARLHALLTSSAVPPPCPEDRREDGRGAPEFGPAAHVREAAQERGDPARCPVDPFLGRGLLAMPSAGERPGEERARHRTGNGRPGSGEERGHPGRGGRQDAGAPSAGVPGRGGGPGVWLGDHGRGHEHGQAHGHGHGHGGGYGHGGDRPGNGGGAGRDGHRPDRDDREDRRDGDRWGGDRGGKRPDQPGRGRGHRRDEEHHRDGGHPDQRDGRRDRDDARGGERTR